MPPAFDTSRLARYLPRTPRGSRGFHQRDRLRIYRANLTEMAEHEQRSHPGQAFAEVQDEGRLNEILSSYFVI
jgi:hypothetical protein